MTKAVVVYVTRTGNPRTIAERLATGLDAQSFLIVDRVNRSGLWGYLRAGFQATTKKRRLSEIREYRSDRSTRW